MSLLAVRKNVWRLLPGIFIACVIWVLWKGLWLDPDLSTKAELQMPFPDFSLNDVRTKQTIRLEDLRGETQVVHVWASWCGACVHEHDDWMEIKNRWQVSLIGMIYRDDPHKAMSILQKKGDPYAYLLNDQAGKLGISLGLMGTPETFVVDPEGVIRYHHLGVLTVATFESKILPIIEQINREQA